MHPDLATLLGCAALVLAFVPLQAQRARPCAAACAAQGWAAGLAAAWQGWARGEPPLYGLALAALAANGVLIPRVLGRGAEHLDSQGATAPNAIPPLIGLGAVVLAVLAVQPIAGGLAAREGFAFALSTTLAGLVAVAGQGSQAARVAGFAALENGLVLADAGVPGIRAQASLAVGLAVLATAGAVMLGMRERR